MKSLLLISVLFLSACVVPVTSHPPVSQEEVRAEEARQRALVEKIQAEGGLPKKWKHRPQMYKQFERVADRIEKAGADLCREMGIPRQDRLTEPSLERLVRPHVSPKRSCYYYFELSRSRELNAYADGTSVIMNSGMMRFLNSDDEVAGVLGHELAHSLMRHRDAQTQNMGAGTLAGVAATLLLGPDDAATRKDITETGAVAGGLVYSIPFEQEADYIGLYIMARAGYDIRQIPYLWRRMSIEFPDQIYFSETHPGNAERFVALQKTIDEIEYKRKRKIPLLPELRTQ